jgi:hypothetical protein
LLTNGAANVGGALGVGTHLLTAHYDGDVYHLPADSAVLKEVVPAGGICIRPIIPVNPVDR